METFSSIPNLLMIRNKLKYGNGGGKEIFREP